MANKQTATAKLGLAAGTVAAAFVPPAADASFVIGSGGPSISMTDFFSGNGTAGWDVDSDGNVDFNLVAGRGSQWLGYHCDRINSRCNTAALIREGVGINPFPNSVNEVLVGGQGPAWSEYLAAPLPWNHPIGPTVSNYQFRPHS